MAKPTPILLRKAVGGLAAGKDPYEIIRQRLHGAVHLQHHGILAELDRVGIKEHLQFSFAHEFLNALAVVLLDAGKRGLPIGERNAMQEPNRPPQGKQVRASESSTDPAGPTSCRRISAFWNGEKDLDSMLAEALTFEDLNANQSL